MFPAKTVIVSVPPANYSIRLDGTDDHIDCGAVSAIPSASALTISLWFNSTTNSGNRLLFGDSTSGSITMSCEWWGNDRLYLELGSGIYCYFGTFSSLISTGTWYHLAWVYDGSGDADTDKIKLYIDGTARSLTYAGTIPTSLSGSIGDFLIGEDDYYSANGGVNFYGKMDDVAIWDVAIDPDAAAAVYNNGRPFDLTANKGNYDNSGDLVAYWRMNKGEGTSVVNTANSGTNDGTLVNGTVWDTDVPN
jgi:hypothetical protein